MRPSPQPKLSGNERLKEADPTLAGTIAATLRDASADHFSEDDNQFLKFHGIYQQDDRDLRKTGKKYIFMVRCRIPAACSRPAQYLACDDLATRYANNTLRVTSRQGLQFHGVVKGGLGPLVKEHQRLPAGHAGGLRRRQPQRHGPADARARHAGASRCRSTRARWPRRPRPDTRAYHSIWIDGVPLDLDDRGEQGLRRSALRQDLPAAQVQDRLRHPAAATTSTSSPTAAASSPSATAAASWPVTTSTAGGGMGRSHGNEATFPRLADVIGFLPPEKVVDVAKAVLTIHRDFGDRTNRKHARLKYVLEDRGAEVVPRRAGAPGRLRARPIRRPFKFDKPRRRVRLARAGGRPAVPRPVRRDRPHQGHGRLAAEDGAARGGREVPAGDPPHPGQQRHPRRRSIRRTGTEIDAALRRARRHRSDRQGSVLRRGSMACVALPTCGLAAGRVRALPAGADRPPRKRCWRKWAWPARRSPSA